MKRKMLHISKHSIIALLSVCMLVSSSSVVYASPEQRQLYNNRILYFNHDDDAELCEVSPGANSGGTTVTANLESFIDTYGQSAFDIGKRNGIPYDAILAQASIESNYGQSSITIKANSFFGIKASSSWTGPTITAPTREQRPDGSEYYVNGVFEAYPTAAAGFQGYVDFLKRNPRYKDVFNYQDNPVGYIQALRAAGYATDLKYVEINTTRLSAVQKYIASKNLFPPSSEVVYDVQPPGAVAGPPAATASCAGGNAAIGGDATGVVAIAIREAQNWGNSGGYQKYTDGRGENWCADFVSWVYREAGKPFTPAPGVAMINGWQIPAVSSLQKYLEVKGQYWPKSTAPAPQPGDIVIYKNGASHTNIIVEANGYMVKTVGGNQGGSNGQGAFYQSSDVTMSNTAFDIRNDRTASGWGRLP